ncbi:hypothetical protein Droror1_Dr00015726 [Drosera rotundifolia]
MEVDHCRTPICPGSLINHSLEGKDIHPYCFCSLERHDCEEIFGCCNTRSLGSVMLYMCLIAQCYFFVVLKTLNYVKDFLVNFKIKSCDQVCPFLIVFLWRKLQLASVYSMRKFGNCQTII